MRAVHLDLDIATLPVGLETMVVRSFRKVAVYNTLQASKDNLDRFHDFLCNHSSLREIEIRLVLRSWRESDLGRSHISAFLEAVEKQSLDSAMQHSNIVLSPMNTAGSETRLDAWQVIEVSLIVKSALVEILSLVATVFPKVVSLNLNNAESRYFFYTCHELHEIITESVPFLNHISGFLCHDDFSLLSQSTGAELEEHAQVLDLDTITDTDFARNLEQAICRGRCPDALACLAYIPSYTNGDHCRSCRVGRYEVSFNFSSTAKRRFECYH
ncbi:hypothetical protein C8J56DRAFT_352430 [Mycena floridula]|nr:hypothetical protein C8J56DRAFT_352430 [Mycena floridula]